MFPLLFRYCHLSARRRTFFCIFWFWEFRVRNRLSDIFQRKLYTVYRRFVFFFFKFQSLVFELTCVLVIINQTNKSTIPPLANDGNDGTDNFLFLNNNDVAYRVVLYCVTLFFRDYRNIPLGVVIPLELERTRPADPLSEREKKKNVIGRRGGTDKILSFRDVTSRRLAERVEGRGREIPRGKSGSALVVIDPRRNHR